MSEKFEKLRFRVAKTGRAKYISHLDFVRCVQRAIRRSGLPVHYTNGFHPHMEAVFATALPLGMESIGEVLFALQSQLNQKQPELAYKHPCQRA